MSGATAVFTPAAALGFDAAYTATVATGVKDLAGNPFPYALVVVVLVLTVLLYLLGKTFFGRDNFATSGRASSPAAVRRVTSDADAAALDPSPIEEWLFYDHPSARKRIFAAMRWRAEQPAVARVP